MSSAPEKLASLLETLPSDKHPEITAWLLAASHSAPTGALGGAPLRRGLGLGGTDRCRPAEEYQLVTVRLPTRVMRVAGLVLESGPPSRRSSAAWSSASSTSVEQAVTAPVPPSRTVPTASSTLWDRDGGYPLPAPDYRWSAGPSMGYGTGVFARRLAERPSPSMRSTLAQMIAAARASSAGCQVRWVLGDVLTLGWRPAATTSSRPCAGVHHLPCPPAGAVVPLRTYRR